MTCTKPNQRETLLHSVGWSACRVIRFLRFASWGMNKAGVTPSGWDETPYHDWNNKASVYSALYTIYIYMHSNINTPCARDTGKLARLRRVEVTGARSINKFHWYTFWFTDIFTTQHIGLAYKPLQIQQPSRISICMNIYRNSCCHLMVKSCEKFFCFYLSIFYESFISQFLFSLIIINYYHFILLLTCTNHCLLFLFQVSHNSGHKSVLRLMDRCWCIGWSKKVGYSVKI